MSKSPSLRRIQADIRELALDPSDQYHAAPLEDDMFEWHFTIRGATGTEFEGGIYHGRILLPPEYPFKPPHIMFLTPSGRFETNTKICLSFTAFHEELWQPAWGIRLILEALISFLPTPADGAIGALDWSKEERKRLAEKSVDFHCRLCGKCADFIPKVVPHRNENTQKPRFQKEIEQLQQLQQQEQAKKTIIEASTETEGEENEKVAMPASPVEDLDPLLAKESEPPTQVDSPKVSTRVYGQPDVVHKMAVQPDKEESNESKNVDPSNPEVASEEEEKAEETDTREETSPPMLLDRAIDRFFPDTALHTELVLFAILCYMFIRKMKALQDDLWELQHLNA